MKNMRTIAMSAAWSAAVCGLAVWLLAGQPLQAQTPFDSDFDHFTTGWPLEGAHRNADCSRCHVGGIFQGTSRECSDCHSLAGLVRSTPLPPDHIRVNSNQCQDCHLETSWAPVYRVDHFLVQGSCGDCHNNVMATGKNPGHVESDNNCGACHSTNAWLPAFFDHSRVMPGSCNTCHLNDKNPGHLVTTESCDSCHLTTAWLPAFFSHDDVAPGTCNTCHLGDKNPAHIATAASCDACHLTTGWLPASYNHDNVAPGSCNTCHAGDKNPGHFITSESCDACHVTTAWLPSTFVHMSAAYPGDHAVNLDCTDCHGGNSMAVTWPAPAYQPDCAACHAGDFRSGPHRKTESPETFYNVSELRDCAGACHIYTDTTLTTIQRFRNGPEHTVRSREF